MRVGDKAISPREARTFRPKASGVLPQGGAPPNILSHNMLGWRTTVLKKDVVL